MGFARALHVYSVLHVNSVKQGYLSAKLLSDSKRTNLENLSELQWEVLARSWKNNIDFWTPEMKKFYGPGFFLAHWIYYRWKHGKKLTRPVMRLAGFPVANRIDKPCNPEYCQNGNGFRDMFENIRGRLF